MGGANGTTSGPGEGTRAVGATLTGAEETFSDYGAKFENTVEPLCRCHDDIVAGAGEFSDALAGGAAGFVLGWRESLNACSQTAGIIAGNVGSYWVDLEAVDIDQSLTVVI